MTRVSTTIQSNGYVGNVISDDLLAINMRFHHNRMTDGSEFRNLMEHIDTSSIRYAGGTISEEYFDITDPNATRTDNIVQVIHPELIPARSDVPIARKITPLNDYLSFVNDRGGEPVVVLPTYRFFDQATRDTTSNAEADIKAFIQSLMQDQYGDVGKVTIEIGNEYYQDRFNWSEAEFGRFQAKVAGWVDEAAKEIGLRDDLTLLAQGGRTLKQNQALANDFAGPGGTTIDGVILHFYGTSSIGDPLAMGRNIPRELAETKQAWGPILGADFEIAVTEWNVGESGEDTTIVNGTMRSAPLLFMFAEMVRGGVDNAMLWAARTDGPAGLSLLRESGHQLTPTGYFFEMLSQSTNGLQMVDPGTDNKLLDSFGQHVGYTYTFEGNDRSVTYFASGVGQALELSADMSQHVRDGAYVYARILETAPDDQVDGYWSDAALRNETDLQLTQTAAGPAFNFDLQPHQLVELHVVYEQGVTIAGDRENVISDELVGSEFDDHLSGERGSDKLTGQAGNDILDGGVGADVLKGQAGDDKLIGGGGKDRLIGGAGSDELYGGGGKDRLFGHNDNDQLNGQAGWDYLDGGKGDDTLEGGRGNDVLIGGDGDDRLCAGAGADSLDGGAGDDFLKGQMGADELFGGDGADVLAGNSGRDQLFGGDGDDQLSGGMGRDSLTGGEGADRFQFADGSSNDVITDFEDGIDAIEMMIEGFGFSDLAVLQEDADTIVRHTGGEIRLVNTNATLIDESDFIFGPL